jgi:anti-anti-sigma factor
MSREKSFHYEVEHSEVDPSEVLDSRGNQKTVVKCHGSVIAETRGQIEDIFKTTPFHGWIVMDLGDVDYVDSAGLGALMRLKLSAAKEAGVSVTFIDMTPRVLQLLKISNLLDWFTT